VQQESETTAIYVTHDQEEAYILSDRLGVMEGGYIRQLGAPREVYSSPRDRFVAQFLGEANTFAATVLDHGDHATAVRVGDFTVPARSNRALPIGAPATLSLRPEHVRLAVPADGAPIGTQPVARVRVTDTRFFGQTVRVRLSDARGAYLVDLDPDTPVPAAGDEVLMCAKPGTAVLLPDS